MFVDKGEYLEIDNVKLPGIRIIYTKKTFGDIREKENQDKFKKLLKIEELNICSGFQTHSSNVVVVDEKNKLYFEDTDGFITSRDDIVIFTKYADCLPIYFYDENKKIFGCVHSGWVGSFKKIGLTAVELMKEKFDSKEKDIIVVFGVGISQKNYEVSEKFYKDFNEKFNENILENVFFKEKNKYYFNNQKINENMLIDIGIKKENILTNDLCTYDGSFHSYRRDKENSGRNGGYIFIDKN